MAVTRLLEINLDARAVVACQSRARRRHQLIGPMDGTPLSFLSSSAAAKIFDAEEIREDHRKKPKASLCHDFTGCQAK
jgi:hypothetical protein